MNGSARERTERKPTGADQSTVRVPFVHGEPRMIRVRLDLGTEHFQDVCGVFGVVDRIGDLGLTESELFPDLGKFSYEVVMPFDLTGAICRKI